MTHIQAAPALATQTAAPAAETTGFRALLRYLAPLGRVLYSFVFLFAVPHHFDPGVIGYAAAQGVPLAPLAVPLSGVIGLVGALSVALGYKARWGAGLLVLFLVPVTFMMHRFWAVTDPNVAVLEQAMFVKNIALLGTALFIVAVGAGPLSVRR